MIKGTGIYAWQLHRCENGDMAKVIDRLKWAGMTHILPKIADGVNTDVNGNWTYLPGLVDLAHKNNIKVFGWQYIYGSNPEAEANRAVTELSRLPFDGFVINAEHQYRDLKGNASAAARYCQALRTVFPDMLIGLSSYRFPSYHRAFPFRTFLEYCDVNLPQVYWIKSDGTVPHQLAQTIREYRDYPSRPIVPTGAAFAEHGWKARAEDVEVFLKEMGRLGFEGFNFWEYWESFHRNPELGHAVTGSVPQKPIEEKEPDAMYVIQMLGNMSIRVGPSGHHERASEKVFALTGETHHSNKEESGWLEITKEGVTGWINGASKWASVMVVKEELEQDLPIPNPTSEERLTALEEKMDEIIAIMRSKQWSI